MVCGPTGEAGDHALRLAVQEPRHEAAPAQILPLREVAPLVRGHPHLPNPAKTWFAFVSDQNTDIFIGMDRCGTFRVCRH